MSQSGFGGVTDVPSIVEGLVKGLLSGGPARGALPVGGTGTLPVRSAHDEIARGFNDGSGIDSIVVGTLNGGN